MSNQDEVNQKVNAFSDEGIDLKDLLFVLWAGKWTIIASSILAATFSVFYALNLPNTYNSDALLAPAEENNGGGLGALAGQLGGIASFAGINLGGTSGDKVTIALEILKSRRFLTEFIEDNNLKPLIMASEKWERSTNKVLYDESIFNESENKWVREVKLPKLPEPSLLEVHRHFLRNNLSVRLDEETGLVTLAVNHVSPFVAQEIAEKLVIAINLKMRDIDITEAVRSIDYLKEALNNTNVADMQQVFYQLIEKQQQNKMLANVRDEYVFKVIDPPTVAEEKSGPNRVMICVLFSMLGGFIGLVLVLMRNFLRK